MSSCNPIRTFPLSVFDIYKPCLPLIHLCSHFCPLHFWTRLHCVLSHSNSSHTHYHVTPGLNGANAATYRFKSVITTQRYSVTWYKILLPQHVTPPIQKCQGALGEVRAGSVCAQVNTARETGRQPSRPDSSCLCSGLEACCCCWDVQWVPLSLKTLYTLLSKI